MSDQTVMTDVSGIERTGEGTILDQSPGAPPQTPTTTPPTTSPPPTTEAASILNKTEAAPTEEKPAEGEKPPEAPKEYADYKVPEGFTLDPEIKKEADTIFRGMNLTQDQAQSLVDFYTSKTQEAFKAPFEAYQKMTQEWLDESMNHPDLRGKLGPGKEVNVRIAKALDGIGDPKLASDFRQAMDLTGAGNHPAFIRVINALAQKVTEGSHVAGNGPSTAGQAKPGTPQPSTAAAMWPNLPSAQGR